MLDGLSAPFRMLAGYIFGGNTKRGSSGAAAESEKVEMTSPVLMTQQQRGGEPNEKVAMTSPVLMTQQQQGEASSPKTIKTMVGEGSRKRGLTAG